MRDYFKRLKHHAGLGTATILTIMGFIAGTGNEAAIWWQGGLVGMAVMGGICWSVVLISNLK